MLLMYTTIFCSDWYNYFDLYTFKNKRNVIVYIKDVFQKSLDGFTSPSFSSNFYCVRQTINSTINFYVKLKV